jgi:isopenicillin-N N-acyltransferase-like protein
LASACFRSSGIRTVSGPDDLVGVPVHCLLRAVLGRRSLEEAASLVEAAPRCASANFLIAQHGPRGPRARDLEVSPQGVAQLEPRGSFLVHTNHFLDPELAEGCTSGFGPSTMNRYEMAVRLADALAQQRDPVRRLQRLLESREGLPYPISRQGNPDPSSSTLAGIVMDLTRNRFILTGGPPHASVWIDRPGVG